MSAGVIAKSVGASRSTWSFGLESCKSCVLIPRRERWDPCDVLETSYDAAAWINNWTCSEKVHEVVFPVAFLEVTSLVQMFRRFGTPETAALRKLHSCPSVYFLSPRC